MSARTSLLIKEPPLQVLPSLATRIGLNEAIVLQQLHYLVQRNKDAPVELRLEEWRRYHFPFWSIPTIKRAFKGLRDQGLVVVAQPGGSDRSNSYVVNGPVVDALAQSDPLEEIKLIPSTGSDRSLGRGQDEPLSIGREVRTTETDEGSSEPSSVGDEAKASSPPPNPLIAEFEDWLEHHERVTGVSPPRAGTAARRARFSEFSARRREGYSLEEMKLASVGAFNDEFRRKNAHFGHESVMRRKKIDGLIAKGRHHAAKGGREWEKRMRADQERRLREAQQ